MQGEVLADFRQKDGTANNTSTPGALNSPGYQLNQVYVYDTLGSLKSTSYPAGTPQDTNAGPLVAARWEYDDLGRKIKAFDSGATTAFSEFRYDSAGNLTFERDENGVENLVLFDELSRPLNLRTSIPAPTETNLQARDQYFATWEYEGNKSSYTNRNGWKTTTLLDYLHNKIRESSERGAQRYDKVTNISNGRPVSASDEQASISSTGTPRPLTSNASLEYDELGRVKKSSSGFVFAGITGLKVEKTAEFDRAGAQVSSGLSLNNLKIYTDTLKYDGLGRVLSQKQVFDRSAQSTVWKNSKAPRDKLVTYKYKGEQLESMKRSEILYNGDQAHFADTVFGYTSDGRLKSANHSFEFRIPSSTATQNPLLNGSASVINTYDNRGFTSTTTRSINVAVPSLGLNELISFTRNETGLVTYQGIKQLGTTLPIDTYVLAPGFTAAPGGLVKNDGRYSFVYDKEGNVTERTSLFQPITIDDQDPDRVTRAAGLSFPSTGNYPTPGGSIQTVAADTYFDSNFVNFSFPEISNEGEYDLWTSWTQSNSFGKGKVRIKVSDTFTGGQIGGLGLEKDSDTGYFKRGNSEGDEIEIDFNILPRYKDASGLLWQFLGTMSLEKNSRVRVLFSEGVGSFAVDAVRLTAHVAKEVIEYDRLNRPVKAASYSLNLSNPSQITEYAYDVLGRLVANRFESPDENISVNDTVFTATGYAYQGSKQVLSYVLADSLANNAISVGKIRSFSFLSLSGELLATDNVATERDGIQLSAWQINYLNGQSFTNSKTLSRQKYSFAGFKTSTSSTDFMNQSRESNRSSYSGTTAGALQTFNSELWQTGSFKVAADAWHSLSPETRARIGGGLQLGAGLVQAGFSIAAGIASCPVTLGAGCAAGIAGAFIGVDNAIAGFETLRTGETAETLLHMGVSAAASQFMSRQNAQRLATGVELVAGFGAGISDDLVRATEKFTRAGNSVAQASRLGMQHASVAARYQLGVMAGGV